jgi:glycosyltransferase involved in cell wall biosynthesis
VARLGVVIPAHNEERTIGRLLDGLVDLADDADVVIACNGCTDGTAAVARRTAPWARVIELDPSSKPAALRVGDRALGSGTRLYLDADVVLDAVVVRRLAAALIAPDVLAVAPTPRYDVSGAGRIVASHYRVWTALQEDSAAIAGTGAMMISEAGRARFGEWPDVIADDYFLDGLFQPEEKRRLRDVQVQVALPRTFRGCVSRRARVHQGNRDVVVAGLRSPRLAADKAPLRLVSLIRERPALIVHVPAHLAVAVATRLLSAWRRWRGSESSFFRDVSTR